MSNRNLKDLCWFVFCIIRSWCSGVKRGQDANFHLSKCHKHDITGSLCLHHMRPEGEITRISPNKHAGIKLCSVCSLWIQTWKKDLGPTSPSIRSTCAFRSFFLFCRNTITSKKILLECRSNRVSSPDSIVSRIAHKSFAAKSNFIFFYNSVWYGTFQKDTFGSAKAGRPLWDIHPMISTSKPDFAWKLNARYNT